MLVTKTINREVSVELDTTAADGFRGIILIEREAPGPIRKGWKRSWSHDGISLSFDEFSKAVVLAMPELSGTQVEAILKAARERKL